jgi:hypothetical protein
MRRDPTLEEMTGRAGASKAATGIVAGASATGMGSVSAMTGGDVVAAAAAGGGAGDAGFGAYLEEYIWSKCAVLRNMAVDNMFREEIVRISKLQP